MARPLLFVLAVSVLFSVASSEALTADKLPENDIPANSFPDTDGNADAAILLPSDKLESEVATITVKADGDLPYPGYAADPLPESVPLTMVHFHPMEHLRPWLPVWFRHRHHHRHHHRRHGPFPPTATQFAAPLGEDVSRGNDMVFFADGSLPVDSFRSGHWHHIHHETPSFWFRGPGHDHHHHHHRHNEFAFDRGMEDRHGRDHEREDVGWIINAIRKFFLLH